MRILVCGGRNFGYTLESNYNQRNVELTNWAVDQVISHQPSLLIQGCAKGGDEIAELVAEVRGIPQLKFPADWKTHGKAAGPIRNQQMLEEGKPDLVIAFRGGKGTQDMVTRARKVGVEVKVYE